METVGACVIVDAGASLGDGVRVEARGGTLTIGRESAIGDHASLVGAVTVGAECAIGDWAHAEGDARLDARARLAAHAVALAGAHVRTGAVVGSYEGGRSHIAQGDKHAATRPTRPRSTSSSPSCATRMGTATAGGCAR